jgi:hypothetical protein
MQRLVYYFVMGKRRFVSDPDLAVAHAFRNGPIEDIHANREHNLTLLLFEMPDQQPRAILRPMQLKTLYLLKRTGELH